MRLTRKVFTDLALYMMAFGLSIGLVFPFFVTILGVPKQYAITASFFMACVSAGLVAGIVNYFLARKIVGNRLKTLSRVGQRMRSLADNMRSGHHEMGSDLSKHENIASTSSICGDFECQIEVDSDDEFGESAKAFNVLVETLGKTITTERAARSFTNLLTTHLDIEPLTIEAINKLIFYTESVGGLLALVEQGQLKKAASHGIVEADTVLKSSYVSRAIKDNSVQMLRIPDDERLVVDHVVGKHKAKFVLVYPILYKSVSLGVVVLVSENEFNQEIMYRLNLLGVGLGLALNNSLTHGRMRILATLDPLTEIYNRGFGMKRLHEEFSRSVRADVPMGVIMLDVDDFKRVNDTYGHMVGDKVLVSVVKSAKKMLREGDILIRYGGEEFLAVLPGASLEDVAQVGERIRRAVEAITIKDGDHTIKVTASLGGVSHPELNVDHEEALVRSADSLLYVAKQSGKNRLELTN